MIGDRNWSRIARILETKFTGSERVFCFYFFVARILCDSFCVWDTTAVMSTHHIVTRLGETELAVAEVEA